MKYWLFCVTTQEEDGKIYDPKEILKQRFEDRFWGLGEKTPNRRYLQTGDKVVFYLGNPHKDFSASAVLASNSFQLSPEQQDELAHGKTQYRADYGVRLQETVTWEQPRRVEDLLPGLEFIENKPFWYVYFQGGVRQLGERDFDVITENIAPSPLLLAEGAGVPGTTSAAEFALEAHLEEFMAKNWHGIDFGRKLKLATDDEQTGRQFPAGPWSIDFLCKDEVTGALVVIELKRGQTSDSTVGQILRYINWVRENIASDGQFVEGIIIAREVDQALHYAIKDQGHISVLTYRVDFKLNKGIRT